MRLVELCLYLQEGVRPVCCSRIGYVPPVLLRRESLLHLQWHSGSRWCMWNCGVCCQSPFVGSCHTRVARVFEA